MTSITPPEAASPRDGQTEELAADHRHQRTSHPSYKGRVRTGCVVCRARKVKCDEQRPNCQKCTRLGKPCVYRMTGRRMRRPSPPSIGPVQGNCQQGGVGVTERPNLPWLPAVLGDCPPHEPPATPRSPFDTGVFDSLVASHHVAHSDSEPDARPDIQRPAPLESQPGIQATQQISLHTGIDASPTDHGIDTAEPQNSLNIATPSSVRFHQTAQVISLTLAMDWLAASEAPTQSSFSYFTDEVALPVLSCFDYLNWTRIKAYTAQLGMQEPLVAKGILATQAIYRAQVDRLPTTHAMSVYQATIDDFELIVHDATVDFHLVLVVALLLCLCELILPNEDRPTFRGFDASFAMRLEASLSDYEQPPISTRIGCWLRLLDTSAKRGGSPGLLPEPVSRLLYERVTEIPSLSLLDCDTHPENSLYDVISAPVFAFHIKVQNISNRVANVTHYHRSRITPADQAEVSDIMVSLKTQLSSLWESRPGPLRLQPSELREHFLPAIADPLISLAAVCLTAYFAELVAIGRILGDPMFASPEARQAMQQIRNIVDGDWHTSSSENGLNPGFLRPLFLYGLESFEEEHNQWAADRLRRIQNPISRSRFFATFLELHGKAQRSQQRRVTMKYFCYQTFGVPLPFM